MRGAAKIIILLLLATLAQAESSHAFEWKLAENDGRDPMGTCLARDYVGGCIAEAWAAYVVQREPILDERDWRHRPKSQETIERDFYRIDVYELTIEDIPVSRRSTEDWTWPAVSTLNRFDVPSWRYRRVTLRPGDLAIDVYYESCHPTYQCLNLIDHAVRVRDFRFMPLERLRRGCSPRVKGEECYDPWQRQSIEPGLLKRVHDACYRTGCGTLTFSRGRGFPIDVFGTYIIRRKPGKPGWELIDVDTPQIGGSIPDYPSALSVRRFPGRYPKFETPYAWSLGDILLWGPLQFATSMIADCSSESRGKVSFNNKYYVASDVGSTTCDGGEPRGLHLTGGVYRPRSGLDFRAWGDLRIHSDAELICRFTVDLNFVMSTKLRRWRAEFDNACSGKREWLELYVRPIHAFLFEDDR